MKRKSIVLLLMLGLSMFECSQAYCKELTPVSFRIKRDECFGNPVFPRTPVQVPSVSLDEHTLYLYSGCDNTTIEVLDENEQVVYSAFVAEGTVTIDLPSELTGTYTLRVIRGSFAFVGEIEL